MFSSGSRFVTKAVKARRSAKSSKTSSNRIPAAGRGDPGPAPGRGPAGVCGDSAMGGGIASDPVPIGVPWSRSVVARRGSGRAPAAALELAQPIREGAVGRRREEES